MSLLPETEEIRVMGSIQDTLRLVLNEQTVVERTTWQGQYMASWSREPQSYNHKKPNPASNQGTWQSTQASGSL